MRRWNLLLLAGVLVVTLGFMASPSVGWTAYGDFLSSISSGSLNQPAKVAVDSANGDVYVTDAGNKLVKKYDKDGNYISSFSLTVSGTPVGIAVNANNIFVGDDTNDCVWIYDKTGVLTDLGNTGIAHKLGGPYADKLRMPNTVAIAPSGQIFVVDGDQDKGTIFRADGSKQGTFGASGLTTATDSGLTIYWYYPSGIAFGDSTPDSPSAGYTTVTFYVGDQGNCRIKKLTYVYNTTQKNITTVPTFVANIGTKGDAFGQFLRVSDLAWDSKNSRLAVADSLQMVVQQFNSDGSSRNAAFNYVGGAVDGKLNIPTGIAAIDGVDSGKLYVASNQDSSIAVFNKFEGNAPTISVTAPATAVVPCTPTYTVTFSGTDQDSGSVTVRVYYYNTSTPSNKILLSTQTATVTDTNFSGTAILDLVGTYPSFMVAGTYGIYAEVIDTTSNTANITAAGTVGITLVAGKTNYTCSQQAAWDPGNTGTVDTDSDGVGDIDEMEGTFNTAYTSTPTNPLDKDTDHDGLDDGVEMRQRTLAQNVTITLAGGLIASATNPNDTDSDDGGISDAVEIVKATDPKTGSDDLVVASSPQDMVCDYFIDGQADQPMSSATMTFKNIDTKAIVVDFTFYNLNGTVLKKVPAAFVLAENQSVRFDPYATYGVVEASLEVRSTSTRIAGDLYRWNHNYNNTAYSSMGGSANMWLPARKGTHLYSVVWNDTDDPSWRFLGFVNVKNWSDSTANVTINFYRNTDGSLTPVSLALAGHQATNLRPRDYVPAGWVGGAVEVTSDVPVTATEYIERFNSGDANLFDWSYIYPFDNSVTSTSYGPMWTSTYSPTYQNPSDANYRFWSYLYLYNPDDTESISMHLVAKDMTGTVCIDKSWTIGPHLKTGVQPINNFNSYGYTAWPTGGTYTVDATYTTGPNTGLPAPHISSIMVQRYNLTLGPNYLDYAYYTPSLQDTGVLTQYIGEYRDYPTTEANQRFNCYCYIWNPDPVNTVHTTFTYYSMDGSVYKTVSRDLTPGQRTGVRPYNGADKGPNEGTFTITSSDYPFIGFMMQQNWNIDDPSGNLIDNAFVKMYWR